MIDETSSLSSSADLEVVSIDVATTKSEKTSPPRGSNSQPSDCRDYSRSVTIHTRHKSLTLYPIELGGRLGKDRIMIT